MGWHISEEPMVFVIDDDAELRSSVVALIHSMGLPAESFASAAEFLAVFDRSQPGCLLVDLRMPEMSGLELQEKLVADGCRQPFIMLTGHGDIPLSVLAMKLGAVDFLEKPYRAQELVDVIRKALKMDARQRRQLAKWSSAWAAIAQLTRSEHDVLERIVDGKLLKVIACELELSKRSVQYRKASLMKKLRVDSVAALVSLVRASQPHLDDVVTAGLSGTPVDRSWTNRQPAAANAARNDA